MSDEVKRETTGREPKAPLPARVLGMTAMATIALLALFFSLLLLQALLNGFTQNFGGYGFFEIAYAFGFAGLAGVGLVIPFSLWYAVFCRVRGVRAIGPNRHFHRMAVLSAALGCLAALMVLGQMLLAAFGCAYRFWAMVLMGALIVLYMICGCTLGPLYLRCGATQTRAQKVGFGLGVAADIALVGLLLFFSLLLLSFANVETGVRQVNGQKVVVEGSASGSWEHYYEYRNFLWRGDYVSDSNG